MSLITCVPESPASLVAVTWKAGVNGSVEQPVTCSGADAVWGVASEYESVVTVTFAGVAGQLAGIRTPLRVVLIACTWIGRVSGPSLYASGMLANEMFTPKPAGPVAGRTATSPGEPSCEVWP